jgi:hypothetical protein
MAFLALVSAGHEASKALNFDITVECDLGKAAVRTAVPRILLIRMKSEVQVLPDPLPAEISENASRS